MASARQHPDVETQKPVVSYRTQQISFVSEIPPFQTRQDTRAVSRDVQKTAAVSCHVIVRPQRHKRGVIATADFLPRHHPPRPRPTSKKAHLCKGKMKKWTLRHRPPPVTSRPKKPISVKTKRKNGRNCRPQTAGSKKDKKQIGNQMGDMGNTFYCRVGDLGNTPLCKTPKPAPPRKMH